MNDNDIKKALECCSSSTGAEACRGCPFNEKDICDKEDDAPQKYALDLINRLEAEIERYKGVIKLLENDVQTGKVEAVKAFVKKFEKKIKNVKFTIGQTWEIKCALKQTLQEMTQSVNYGSSKTVK